jgi:hypothetical protein
MDRTTAILNLITEGRLEVIPSQTRVNRVVKSCKALDIEGPELWRVLGHLDIALTLTGDPFGTKIKRTWP